jgi:hypothetical protein
MRWKALATVRAEDSVDWLLDLAPEVATRIGGGCVNPCALNLPLGGTIDGCPPN